MAGDAERLFKERWKLNYLIGQAIEAKNMSTQACVHARGIKQYSSDYPQLAWQFVVFGHNEHVISLAKNLAKELGVRFSLKLSWDARLSPVRDQESIRKEVGVASRDEFKEKHGVDYMQGICRQLWD